MFRRGSRRSSPNAWRRRRRTATRRWPRWRAICPSSLTRGSGFTPTAPAPRSRSAARAAGHGPAVRSADVAERGGNSRRARAASGPPGGIRVAERSAQAGDTEAPASRHVGRPRGVGGGDRAPPLESTSAHAPPTHGAGGAARAWSRTRKPRVNRRRHRRAPTSRASRSTRCRKLQGRGPRRTLRNALAPAPTAHPSAAKSLERGPLIERAAAEEGGLEMGRSQLTLHGRTTAHCAFACMLVLTAPSPARAQTAPRRRRPRPRPRRTRPRPSPRSKRASASWWRTPTPRRAPSSPRASVAIPDSGRCSVSPIASRRTGRPRAPGPSSGRRQGPRPAKGIGARPLPDRTPRGWSRSCRRSSCAFPPGDRRARTSPSRDGVEISAGRVGRGGAGRSGGSRRGGVGSRVQGLADDRGSSPGKATVQTVTVPRLEAAPAVAAVAVPATPSPEGRAACRLLRRSPSPPRSRPPRSTTAAARNARASRPRAGSVSSVWSWAPCSGRTRNRSSPMPRTRTVTAVPGMRVRPDGGRSAERCQIRRHRLHCRFLALGGAGDRGGAVLFGSPHLARTRLRWALPQSSRGVTLTGSF